jgi:CubicO group peptidase (beta-lactamase class C family)
VSGREAVRGVDVDGFVAPGFQLVREEFERNFAERGELGAAFAVYRDGEPVVDLWGGVADRASGRPWTADTIQLIFSGSKGLVAVCVLMLIERGLLDLEMPVARYWPEFAQAGKERVLVRDVMGHTARLPGLATPVSWQEATDDVRMAQLLAAQRQSDDPRAASAYHAITFGWLAGELVRRVDGRSVGRFFAEEVAQPLELELWIGLPEGQEPRVATLEPAPSWDATMAAVCDEDPLLRSVFANPPRFGPGPLPANERAWRAAEVPASNAVGTARSIARLYGCLDRLLRPETLALGRVPLNRGPDLLRGCPMSWGVGFALQTPLHDLGPPPDAFGAGGAGGSSHGCWPSQRVGFSYALNLLGIHTESRPPVLDALYACVEGPPSCVGEAGGA